MSAKTNAATTSSGAKQFSVWNKMIVYSRITPADCPAVAEHMLTNFFKYEPFGLALGLTVDQVAPWYHKFLEELLNYYEPVSFIAKDTDTNEIAGAVINIIVDLNESSERKPPPAMKPYIDKKKQPQKWQIAQFLEDLEHGLDVVKALKLDPTKPQKALTCLFLSVNPKYGGKGLAKTLIRESEQEAKQIEGVTIAMTETTSHWSYLAFKKLDYVDLKEVIYLSYKDPDGIPIFEGREEKLGIHTHANVMAKPL